jgi:hypothetical protein
MRTRSMKAYCIGALYINFPRTSPELAATPVFSLEGTLRLRGNLNFI